MYAFGARINFFFFLHSCVWTTNILLAYLLKMTTQVSFSIYATSILASIGNEIDEVLLNLVKHVHR